jgi:hypothetical protein
VKDWDAINRQTKVISRAKLKGLNANVLSRAHMMAACVDQDHDLSGVPLHENSCRTGYTGDLTGNNNIT